jgi:hypothetical protein
MSRRNSLFGTAAALFTIVTTVSAAADIYTPTSEAMTDPTIGWATNEQAAALGTVNLITVTSDGDDYQSALDTHLALPFHIKTEVRKSKWRIRESFIVIGAAPLLSGGNLYGCCGSLSEFNQYNYASAVPHDETKKVDRDAWWAVEVDDNSIGTRARNACRLLREKLQDQGLSKSEIFGQDRSTKMATEFRYVARVGHRRDGKEIHEAGDTTVYWKQSQPAYADLNVLCQRDLTSEIGENPNPDPKPNPSGSNDIAVGFQVKQAALAITPKDYEAKCPAKLHLNPTIETNGKGTVKYRLVDQLGNKSQTFQVKFDKADVKFLDHVIEIDGKGKPKGLGFKAPQAQNGALGLIANTQPNLTQGYFKLEVIAPHKKVSNLADYSVKCTNKTAGDGKLAPKPDVVKPGVVVGDLVLPTADLVVDWVQYFPQFPTMVRVQVSNKGAKASTATSLKALRWVGNQATSNGNPIESLDPGESQIVMAEIGGSYDDATHVYVRVDDPNQVKETNEGNNSFKAK